MQRRHDKKLLAAMAVTVPVFAGAAPLEYYDAGNPSNRRFSRSVRAGGDSIGGAR